MGGEFEVRQKDVREERPNVEEGKDFARDFSGQQRKAKRLLCLDKRRNLEVLDGTTVSRLRGGVGARARARMGR